MSQDLPLSNLPQHNQLPSLVHTPRVVNLNARRPSTNVLERPTSVPADDKCLSDLDAPSQDPLQESRMEMQKSRKCRGALCAPQT